MRAPEFWYAKTGRDAAPLTRALLTPLSWLYGALAQYNHDRVQPTRIGVPVICIGNASVGGTGKTPVAMRIAQILQAQGHNPAFLTRGYKRKAQGNVQVDLHEHCAIDVGDEALLLAHIAPTFVGADRVISAQMAVQSGADCIVMDDGLQNPQLRKDFSLLVVDGKRGFGNGRLLPAGPLRERIADALNRVQGILVMGEGAPKEVAGRTLWHGRLHPLAPPPKGRLFAFAGIGDPQRFFDALRGAGADVVQEWPFPDHHAYSARDMQRIVDWARAENATPITTEKDHVRLPRAQQEQVLAWPVQMVLDETDEAALSQQLGELF